MTRTSPCTLVAPTLLAFAMACTGGPASPATPPSPSLSDTALPPIQREMRGLWIATVANIDWPSRAGLSAAAQRAELTTLLDRAAALGSNAVIFQVRPASDAVYRSTLEPWASLLSGTQGTDPGYDPLAFAVEQAHARGLQLHAWINPFRAGNTKDSASLSPTHLFHARRDLVRVYGTQLWLDPGDPEAQDHVSRVLRDIIARYDVDAIHADDYFYPYPQNDAAGHALPFPDSATYARSGSALALDDWRRANIDRFVERLYRDAHAVKPGILMGISPFGIWRPGNPPGVAGFDAYASIHADSRRWLQQGWVDYLAPQLYWAISAPQQSFPALLDWWVAQSVDGRPIWPGLAAYRVNSGTATTLSSEEIPEQVRLTRARPGATGHILYNASSTLTRAGGAVAASLAPLYQPRALVPSSPWLSKAVPSTPGVRVNGRVVSLTPAPGEEVRWWHLRVRANGLWSAQTLFGTTSTLTLSADPECVVVNAISRTGATSADAAWRRP
jgi:Uncharacterized protein conserved in bacteria